jgi:hypothetical protein
LATFDIRYERASEEPWSYTGDLWQRVWTDYRETDWGQRAFLLLLSHGWDTGVDCAAGRDQFRQIIQQGVPFMQKHPNSPYRLDAQLAVAQAYETWRSLGQAATPGQDPAAEEGSVVNPQQYQEGAETSRQKAIASYEQLLQTSPQSDHAAYARRQLPRLKLGLDSGQRRFYCIVGD